MRNYHFDSRRALPSLNEDDESCRPVFWDDQRLLRPTAIGKDHHADAGTPEKPAKPQFRRGVGMLPTPSQWKDLDNVGQAKALTHAYSMMGLDRQDIDENKIEWVLEEVEALSAKRSNYQVFSWVRRVTFNRWHRCPNQIKRIYRGDQGERKVQWINCGLRSCYYCQKLRAGDEARDLIKRFTALGRQVYLLDSTWEKASNIVDYATKKGEAVVAIPKANGTTMIFTTHARKDAIEIFTSAVHVDSMEDEMYRALVAVPAYSTKAGDPQHRVRMNNLLRSQETGPPPEKRKPKRPDDVEEPPDKTDALWRPLPESALRYVVENRFPLQFDKRGRIIQFSFFGVAPHLVERYLLLEEGTPFAMLDQLARIPIPDHPVLMAA